MEQRERKYRAWTGEEMIYLLNSGIQYFDFEGSYALSFVVDGYGGFWSHEQYERPSQEASKFPLMEFIGLKDRVKNDLYEMDIVEHGYTCERGTFVQKNVVMYSVKNAQFYLGNLNSPQFNMGAITDKTINGKNKIFKVIGNIYQNPELIKIVS